MTKEFDSNRVRIFDTTLRDGEQSPGAAMTLEQKLEIAVLLQEMGVDIIEAGFPNASNGDFEAVRAISAQIQTVVVCALARSGANDIRRAGEAVRGAKHPRIHTFISTSEIHMKHKLQMSPDDVLAAITSSVTLAREYTDDVEWSPEDATRTDFDFLCFANERALVAGARTINIPDTVGYTTPQEYFELMERLIARFGAPDIVYSTHCHDDLGLATANSFAGVLAGARQVECTINGIGERAGNAALEEIVMGLRVRNDALPFVTGVNPKMFARVSKLVSGITGFPVQYNKAIVGKNAHAHESGIHQDGMLKNPQTYQIIRAEDVGVAEFRLPLGKLSGRRALQQKLLSMGYPLEGAALAETFSLFKELADKKRHIFDDDLEALVVDVASHKGGGILLKALRYEGGIGVESKASVSLLIDSVEYVGEGTGDGTVDAVTNAIRAAYPHEVELEDFKIRAVTVGTDAQAQVHIRLKLDGHIAAGTGVHTDMVTAVVHAYVTALGKLHLRRDTLPTD